MVEKSKEIGGVRIGKCCPYCNSAFLRYQSKDRVWICYDCREKFKTPEERAYDMPTNFVPKRKPEDIIMWDKEKLLNKVRGLNTLRDKALVSVVYLTGARISEIIKRLHCGQIRGVEKEINGEIHKVVYFHNLFTLKKKKSTRNKYRDVPVVYEQEKELLSYVDSYLELMSSYYSGEEEFENGVLFPISRQAAHQMIKKQMGIWCHFLRTMRFTHLVNNKNLDAFDLKKLANWSSIAPSEYYVMRNLKDIEKKMVL